MSDLKALIERVREATGADRALDLALATALAPDVLVLRRNDDDTANEPHTYWEYTGKVDDALALVERMLPGWRYAVVKQASSTNPNAPDGFHCWLEDPEGNTDHQYGPRTSAPLAILAAMLSALSTLTQDSPNV